LIVLRQLGVLTTHRRLRRRSPQSEDPSKIIWTRTSKGAAVTELDKYWAQVELVREGKFGFTVYAKDFASPVCGSLTMTPSRRLCMLPWILCVMGRTLELRFNNHQNSSHLKAKPLLYKTNLSN
jgi:hypothetical protein